VRRIFSIVLVAAVLAGCAGQSRATGRAETGGRASENLRANGLKDAPVFVSKTYQTSANDVLVGIGAYNFGGDMSKTGMARIRAETRARTDVSRQFLTIVKNMVTDYLRASELDPDAAVSFQEGLTKTLSKSDLSEARVIQWGADKDGIMWVVVQYDKAAASAELNKAVNTVVQRVPQVADFDVQGRMDTSFNKKAGGGPDPVID
jgi:hypothetical protein